MLNNTIMNKKTLAYFALLLLLSSCFSPDIRFVQPQPEHLNELITIPEKFQGVFLVKQDTITVTKHTINEDSINSKEIVVKGWGNHLFVNKLEDSLYKFSYGTIVESWNHTKLNIKYFSSDIWLKDISNTSNEQKKIDLLISEKQYPIIDIDTVNGYFILDNVSVNQFQHLLNNAESEKVTRLQK
mgnify:CR=1 FL=1